MRNSIAFLLSALLLSACTDQSPKDLSVKTIEQNAEAKAHPVKTKDSVTSRYNVQVGNDKGFVVIQGGRNLSDGIISNSTFNIQLQEIEEHFVEVNVNTSNLIDSNKFCYFLDSANQDFTSGAVIESIEFASIRSNTLYFKATLINPAESKLIQGRFNLFYRTKKKGMIYGWITDEVEEQNIAPAHEL